MSDAKAFMQIKSRKPDDVSSLAIEPNTERPRKPKGLEVR